MLSDITTIDRFLGPSGGELALVFAAGCVAGYAFCIRTLYKVLKEQKDKDESECSKRIEKLEEENKELEKRIAILEDRLFHGMSRQAAQVRESTAQILGREKLGGQPDDSNRQDD